MAASSLTNFTLSYNRCTKQTPKFPHPTSRNRLRTLNSSSLSSLCFHPKLCQTLARSRISSKPTSETLFSAFSPAPQKNTSKFLVEKIATLLLGSLVFIGFSRLPPALAAPVQESKILEEKKGAQYGKSIDDEEEARCVKLLLQNPKDIEALKMVVNVKMKKGKPKEAVVYVEKLIELQPKETEWRLLQALCYEMIEDYGKARSLFKDILKKEPLLPRALHGLAMVMHKNKEGPAVFDMLERALSLAHREKRVIEERNIKILTAQMHIVKGDFEEALAKFQDLISENPRDFRPYLCQGIVYSLLEMKKEAEECFQTYRSLVPDEFPERGFLDDVVLAAKTESKQQLKEDLLS